MDFMLIKGDARRIPLADQSVHCVVTSPPYWGLRDYGVGGQIGMESTPDDFVASMVAVFREVWRVLRNDGTLWLNLGDSYCTVPHGPLGANTFDPKYQQARARGEGGQANRKPIRGLKHKDLVGIPWRVALALQADGWYLRSDIIWAKPNPMPESVSDRPTKAHEYIFLMTKSDRYFYDADAIREPVISPCGGASFGKQNYDAKGTLSQSRKLESADERNHPLGRNKRSVWHVPVNGFDGAHFATFPTKLIEPCVKAGCPKNGIVFDPFNGAATTGVVATGLGRRYIGTDLNPDYLAISKRRIERPHEPKARAVNRTPSLSGSFLELLN